MASVDMVITVHVPMWTRIAFVAARVAAFIGFQLDVDKFSHWLGGYFKISMDVVSRER